MKAYRIYSEEEAGEICGQLDHWGVGKAASELATGTVKRNQELTIFDGYEELSKDIHDRLSKSELILENFVKTMVFPKFNRYTDGGEYKSHADAGLMGGKLRTDLACTLFLNDGYKGGELCVNGMMLTGSPGTCVVYECWRPHRVNPVTEGERICAVTWMQSWIADATKREVLQMYQGLLKDIDRSGDEERLYPRLSSIYSKLVRMWSN